MKRSALRRSTGEARTSVPVKPKKCAQCKTLFAKTRPLQVACSPECALALARSKREAAERADTRAKLAAMKPRQQLIREAQSSFNAWVRTRDAGLPCISCGRHHDGQYHAGHFLSTGARPELRFDEANCHLQCAPCNTHLSGNLVLYRIELIRRIGMDEVLRLEGPQQPAKLSADALKQIRAVYIAKRKALLAALEPA